MKCVECSSPNATNRCYDCGAYFCTDCSDNYLRVCMCKPETIVDLETFSRITRKKKENKCQNKNT